MNVPWACVRRDYNQDEATFNTYTVERESIHYACEGTIARHRDELAEFLATNYEEYKKKPGKEIAKAACKGTAKCLERSPSETIEARARRANQLMDGKSDQVDMTVKKLKKEMKQKKKEKKKSEDADNVEL